MAEKNKSVGAIWIRTSAGGNEYFSISIEGKSYVGFANRYKEEDKHPDYKIFPSLDKQAQPFTSAPKDDDIPF